MDNDIKLWNLPDSQKIEALKKGIQDLVELLYPPGVPVRVELDISVPPQYRTR